jgi:hypothetical protein
MIVTAFLLGVLVGYLIRGVRRPSPTQVDVVGADSVCVPAPIVTSRVAAHDVPTETHRTLHPIQDPALIDAAIPEPEPIAGQESVVAESPEAAPEPDLEDLTPLSVEPDPLADPEGAVTPTRVLPVGTRIEIVPSKRRERKPPSKPKHPAKAKEKKPAKPKAASMRDILAEAAALTANDTDPEAVAQEPVAEDSAAQEAAGSDRMVFSWNAAIRGF